MSGLGTQNRSGVSGAVKHKIIEIGDWDMDALVSVTVAHGIADITKIRKVSALIRPDADAAAPNYRYPIQVGDGLVLTDLQGFCTLLDTDVGVSRAAAGFFDSVDFDTAANFNRGWIVIEYER